MEQEAVSQRYAGRSGSLRRGVLGLLFAALMLSACGVPVPSVTLPAVVPTATPTARASTTPIATPTARASATPITRESPTPTVRATVTASGRLDCGTYLVSQGERVPDAAYRCFIEALASGQIAQLKETKPTVEGHPIPISYLGDRSGNVVVVTDTRQDGLGTKTVVRQVCTGPTAAQGWLDFTSCALAPKKR